MGLKTFADAVRTICSAEELGTEEARPSAPGRESFLQWLFSREQLPPPAISVPPKKTSFLSWLLVPEDLPAPAGGPGADRKDSLPKTLLAREKLPEGPQVGSDGAPRPSLMSILFAREELAEDPVPEKKRRSRRGR